MPIANTKIVQAYIESINQVVDLIDRADTLAQAYQAKWANVKPDFTGTNLTSEQVAAIESWVADLNNLKKASVLATAKDKKQQSHGTAALG